MYNTYNSKRRQLSANNFHKNQVKSGRKTGDEDKEEINMSNGIMKMRQKSAKRWRQQHENELIEIFSFILPYNKNKTIIAPI